MMSTRLKLSFITVATLASLLVVPAAGAVTGADWKAGHIIDDVIFNNGSAMTVTQIRDFLRSKVPVCDTDGSQPSEFGGGTRAQYGTARGYPPPYVCLRDYYENPTTHVNNLQGRPKPDGAISAAAIIYRAAKTYSISPKVLLATLQKESAGPLITDDWPFWIQYRTSMGYACPDGEPCDSKYYGFYNQMISAAWQFRHYADVPDHFRYKARQNNTVRYSPISSCGSSTVYIANQATASLYNYTPYQPNQAALNNLYGTGNGCSSYGNRNFWRIFNDWFGSTWAPTYKAKLITKSQPVGLKPGQKEPVYVAYQNTGNATWYDLDGNPDGVLPTLLATTKELFRKSKFNGSWQRPDRPLLSYTKVLESDGQTLAANQNKVLPLQIVSFGFDMTAPMSITAGSYDEWFEPVKLMDKTMKAPTYLTVNVPKLEKTSKPVSYNGPRSVRQGWNVSTYVKVKNTGNIVWFDTTTALPGVEPLVLSTARPSGRVSLFGSKYEKLSRPTSALLKVYASDGKTLATNQHTVRPGQIAVWRFVMSVPADLKPGTYTEWLGARFAGLPDLVMGPDIPIKLYVLKKL